MTNSLVNIEQLNKVFYSEDIETHALSNIQLRINKGEYVAISGPSGCGKSTLLSIIGLLDEFEHGSYQLLDQPVEKLSRVQLAQLRNQKIGFIFQSFNLISDLTVFENVELPLTYRPNLKEKTRQQLVNDALLKLDIRHRANHYPAQLSGGQQQRVAIARAVVGQPSLLLADEPTGNLDSKNAEAVMNILAELHQQGSTIVMVTHDPRSSRQANRCIELIDGQIIADRIVDKSPPSNVSLSSTTDAVA